MFSGSGGVAAFTFNSAPQGGAAVTSVGDLGNTGFGNFSFSGSPFGGIGGSQKAFASAHNSSSTIANMTQMAENSVSFGSDFSSPVTRTADAGSGDRLFANFETAGGFTNGESTNISFDLANFGNSNPFDFKYTFVRGLDSSGREVFEMLFIAGSSAKAREVYTRGADDDSTTLTASGPGAGATATPEGTKLIESTGFGVNGTNVANGRPSGRWVVNIELADGKVNYDVGVSGGALGETAFNGTSFDINSDATSIARLEFSSVWRDTANGQNKGYWVDNIFATTTIPAPSAIAVLALGLVGARRRR